jgi:hypothetical protein
MDTKELIEVYKIARNSVEHFDKILGDFRKITFTFNGIIISSGFALYAEHSDKYILFFLASITLGIINVLIWLLEKHYHRYLITAAQVALNIEKELFRGRTQRALTYLIDRARKIDLKWEMSKVNKISNFIRSYDLLYILPIVVSGSVNFFLAYKSSCYKNLLVSAGIALASFYLFVIYMVIRYDYLFVREKLNKPR